MKEEGRRKIFNNLNKAIKITATKEKPLEQTAKPSIH
jgi:hypothetical protein